MKYVMHSGYENQQQHQQDIMKKRERKKNQRNIGFLRIEYIDYSVHGAHRTFPFHNVFRTIFFQSIENYYLLFMRPKTKTLQSIPCESVLCFLCCISFITACCVSIILFSILLMLHFTLKVLEIRNAWGMRREAWGMRLNRV